MANLAEFAHVVSSRIPSAYETCCYYVGGCRSTFEQGIRAETPEASDNSDHIQTALSSPHSLMKEEP